ncbi:hypothetical protein [Geobacillus sp. Geo 8.1]
MSKSLISFESKQKRILILQSLLESLKTHYPNAIFDKSKEGRYRLLIPYTTKDQFIVDFSFEVPDGIRMGFVLDLTFRTLTRSKQRIFYLVFQNNFLTNTTSDGNPFFTIASRSI